MNPHLLAIASIPETKERKVNHDEIVYFAGAIFGLFLVGLILVGFGLYPYIQIPRVVMAP